MQALDARFSGLLLSLQAQGIDPRALLEHGFDSWELVQEVTPAILG
jgi:hypothetical protein